MNCYSNPGEICFKILSLQAKRSLRGRSRKIFVSTRTFGTHKFIRFLSGSQFGNIFYALVWSLLDFWLAKVSLRLSHTFFHRVPDVVFECNFINVFRINRDAAICFLRRSEMGDCVIRICIGPGGDGGFSSVLLLYNLQVICREFRIWVTLDWNVRKTFILLQESVLNYQKSFNDVKIM